MKMTIKIFSALLALLFGLSGFAVAGSADFRDSIFDPGKLKPVDSRLKVKEGQAAPDFTLVSLDGKRITLSDFRGKKNVVISFVPAAWTPVCSDQWPGYNIVKGIFEANDAVLLGITVDNIPTLHAWTLEMGGLWFPVLSDFWPHGKVADTYGILRGDGVTERAIFMVDKAGILRYAHVGDINVRPKLDVIVREMEKLGR